MANSYSVSLVFFGYNWGHILLFGPRPCIISIAKLEQRSSRNQSYESKSPLVIYGHEGGYTHMHALMHAYPHKRNLGKSGAHLVGAHLNKTYYIL